MFEQLVDYAKEAASAKRKELVEDADNQPETRMSDYDRGWLSGYIAALAAIRNEAERIQAREQAALRRAARAWECEICGYKNKAYDQYCDCCGTDRDEFIF